MFRLASLAAGVLACAAAYAQPSTPVILISVDTLRADHLSCYQASRRPTPHIDGLAKNGTLFLQVSTPFPLTLPAHAALLTSTYPFANGVQDNGVPLNPSAVTLAAVLKQAGYRTGAFVGSFVLDRRFGLNRGFDVYDGPLDVRDEGTGAGRKRPGAQVAEAAAKWVANNSGAPFFLFLHLYDLHLPYDLPENPALRHGETGYSAELAYVDRVLGDFFTFLDRRGLLRKSLIAFTSDHGEGLGDHGESTHGYFLYQSTLHVPLLIRWPAGAARRAPPRVEEAASLLDVAPTILEAAGVPRPGEMRGRSLLQPAGPRDIYSESLYARNHFGCAAIRSLRAGSLKFIQAPKPELYDLAADPSESRNLYEQQRAKAAALAERMAAVRATAPVAPPGARRGADPENVRILRSLGYLGGSTASRPESRIDPKERAADFERYYAALDLASAGRLAESSALLEKLGDKLHDVPDIRLSLGQNRQRAGDYAAAAREFKRATGQSPLDAQAHYELGFSYFHLRRLDEAAQELKAALAIEPWYTRADEALAEIYLQKKEFPQARAHLNHLLTIDPRNYTAHYNLGIFAAMEKNWTEAEQRMLSALQANPNSAEAHNALGGIYLQRGDTPRARRHFEEALRLQPKFGMAHYQLGLILLKEGDTAAAEQHFRAAQEAER